MKVVSIVGARPQFIKVAPVSRELRKCHVEVLVHTGQHYDYELSRVFFEELEIPMPGYNLGVGSATHGKQTGEILARVEEVLLKEKPDWVLVYGDTNSTLAGALAAAKLRIPVGHVEAGLRSFNREMPEEINRVLTDHISDLLLCPTETAVKNLAQEGMCQGVYNTGDVMYDAVLNNTEVAEHRLEVLEQLELAPRGYLLATIHRPSNTESKFRLIGILTAFERVGELVVFPAHPRTQKAIHALGITLNYRVAMIQPVSYLHMPVSGERARLILTDSGGVEKDAYLFGGTVCDVA